ncbi:hypothetical protein OIE66_28625 [Nonomuraea sp. NBC_01738]|uniref:hypothetical protein n=1 Tax=Nonomuraea sp. NBC_01738 TaxID=2976003 RepID=UPI002E141A59|nr:hypothetical protein OIE66_28625 [Nonomuraea sp. NBC_01738]
MRGSWGVPRMLIAVVAAVGLAVFALSGGFAPSWQAGEPAYAAGSETWVSPSSTPPAAAREHLNAAWQLLRPTPGDHATPPPPARATWPDSAEFRDPQQSAYRTAGPRSPPVS